jgi:AbrB family looped-hinge helix DNA binding protein
MLTGKMSVRRPTIGKARLSSKGQLTVPAEVRRSLGLARGDDVVFEVVDEGVLMRKAKAARDLIGVIPPLRVDWKTARRKAWAGRAERVSARSSATRTSSSGS